MHLAVPAAPAAHAVALVVAMLVRARGAVLAVGVFAGAFRVLVLVLAIEYGSRCAHMYDL